MNEYGNGERHTFLLGDSGYAQQPWLYRPLETPITAQEKRYNIAHRRIRNAVERCIGVLKSRFRCLCRQRLLMYSPPRAGNIITACAVLHNIMLEVNYPMPSDEDILDNIAGENLDIHGNLLVDEENAVEAEMMTTNQIRQAGKICISRFIRENF